MRTISNSNKIHIDEELSYCLLCESEFLSSALELSSESLFFWSRECPKIDRVRLILECRTLAINHCLHRSPFRIPLGIWIAETNDSAQTRPAITAAPLKRRQYVFVIKKQCTNGVGCDKCIPLCMYSLLSNWHGESSRVISVPFYDVTDKRRHHIPRPITNPMTVFVSSTCSRPRASWESWPVMWDSTRCPTNWSTSPCSRDSSST